MAGQSNKGQLTFIINGKVFNAPVEWEEINVLATFDDSSQPNISTTEITLVRESVTEIKRWIEDGLSGGVGIFEGVPCKIQAYNKNNQSVIFDGYIDLTDSYKEIDYESKIEIKLIKKDGLNTLDQRLSGITYGFLEQQGFYSDADYLLIDYVVEKKINAFELLVSGVILFLMTKTLIETIQETSATIYVTAAFLSNGLFGSVAAAIFAIGKSAALIVYSALLLTATIQLAEQFVYTLIQPTRRHKVIQLEKLLSNVCAKLGYDFNHSIPELNTYYFLPSNNWVDDPGLKGLIEFPRGTQSGVPNSTDPGYICSEMFDYIKRMFNGKYAVIDGAVEFHNVDSDFWIKKSTWRMPSVLQRVKEYNTNELSANRLISFQTDTTDEWTIDNFKGTNYEVITDAISVNNEDAKFIRGLDEISLPYALGNRKSSLNALEEFIRTVCGVIDSVTGALGGGTDWAKSVKNRVGALKVANNNNAVPKILVLSGKKVPTNHRELLSAKYLYENYHTGKSFVENDYYGQKIYYRGVRVPFGFEDYLQLIENSYFYDSEGNLCKATKFEYNLAGDFASIDYYYRKPYTINLQETKVEPS